uniref:Family with sequence similarity 98 member B n=2 Tax=Sinocyclocheilus grahami TaxID=75366 RepID=A0A672NLG0_SINGR
KMLYDGPLAEEACLRAACGRGFSSSEYVSLVRWLSSRLTRITDEHTQEPLITEDPDRCVLDTGRLLKDLCCPYEGLASRLAVGDVKDSEEHLKILLFLASELQAAEIVARKPATDADTEELDTSLQDLRVICETLELPDPAGRDTRDAFTAVEQQVRHPLHLCLSMLMNRCLSERYELSHCRTVPVMPIQTVSKVKIDRMARAYQPKRYSLSLRSSVSVAHLLAARQDICYMVKTSSGSCREKTSCAINRILMGRVPDRGGRPSEIEAPLPEMPAWQKRAEGGGRGGGAGYSGNRGVGGWRSGGDGWRAGRWGRGGRGGQYYH